MKVTLENKIREALPRLKELTKGCIVKDILNNWEYEVIDNKYCPQLYSYQYSTFRTLEFKDLENIDIIGHPIKLNDVLEYIHFLDKNKTSQYFITESYDEVLPNWDLSSVFLADQSSELKEFLNSL